MPEEPLYPGAFLEEISHGIQPIAGVSTGIAAFVGCTRTGTVNKPAMVRSFVEFERDFGALDRGSAISYAVLQFFANGGQQAIIVPVGSIGTPADKHALIGQDVSSGLNALLDVDLFDLLCVPETFDLSEADAVAVADAAIRVCEARRAIYLVDPPRTIGLGAIVGWADSLAASCNAAIYFPAVAIADPLDATQKMPLAVSGSVAGLIARTDYQRGIWKAPAGNGASLYGVTDLAVPMGVTESAELNSKGINALRVLSGGAPQVWGARTMCGGASPNHSYKYLPVRRLALFLEESLRRGLSWTVFESNDERLWVLIRRQIETFMLELFGNGALMGNSPKQAFYVRCGSDTTTQADLDLGVVNVEVGFAPIKPAEFLVLAIRQLTGRNASR